MDRLIDSIVDIDSIAKSSKTAEWRYNVYVQIFQWFLIGISCIDFSIYTINFLYGLFLSVRSLPRFEKLMPIYIGILFIICRFIYIPFLVILLPMDTILIFPKIVYEITFIMLVAMYFSLLLLPSFVSIWWCIKYRIWRNAEHNTVMFLAKTQEKLNNELKAKGELEKIVIIIPIYNEDKEALLNSVKSILSSIYPHTHMTVYLSFDNDEPDDTFLYILSYLTDGYDITRVLFDKRIELVYDDITFIINLFQHNGKRGTQALSFREIKNTYKGREEDMFVLFADSDIILHQDCILEFIINMRRQNSLIGMTGFISAISSRSKNIFWYLQDCEYVFGQIFARSLEASLGGVTCLPGALTIIRLKELSKAAEIYFSELNIDNIFDYHRYYLGEDRYLTQLLMNQSKKYSIGFCASARAKTEAPGTWKAFLKQRRRWLLGAFSNEVYFLSDYKLWLRTSILILYKIIDFASRSAAFFIHIVIFQMLTGVKYNLVQTVIIWTPITINWILLFFMSIVIKRLKVFFVYPLMLFLNPWIYFIVNIYSIATWNTRSWGGPRTSAKTRSVVMVDPVEPVMRSDPGYESVSEAHRNASFDSDDSQNFNVATKRGSKFIVEQQNFQRSHHLQPVGPFDPLAIDIFEPESQINNGR